MSDPNVFPLRTTDGVSLLLLRCGSSSAPKGAVLLLHGASANHKAFTTPDGGGLARYLVDNGFDPWLLDWRASGLVVDDDTNNGELLEKHSSIFNFNAAASYDIKAAVDCMKLQGVTFPIAMIGFCMGSGVLAEAIALGRDGATPDVVDRVVLMTLGLFYEVAIDGQLKCEDRLLERFRRPPGQSADVTVIDPRIDPKTTMPRRQWPSDLDRLYDRWPPALKAHTARERAPGDTGPNSVPTSVTEFEALQCMCNRLGFMYGMPYHHANLVPEIHGTFGVAGKTDVPGLLPELFGAIPLQMFIHGSNNIRQRQATYFDVTRKQNDGDFLSDTALERFNALERVTLITGALNRLWHRNSIDLMFEWLCRGAPAGGRTFKKRVLPDYGHQDLLWGTDARTDVYPLVLDGIIEPEMSAEALYR